MFDPKSNHNLAREIERLRREIAELRARKPSTLQTGPGGGGGTGELPQGEHEWMVLTMVSANQVGWERVRARPITP